MPRRVDHHRYEQTEDWPTDYIETFELPDAILKLLQEFLKDEQMQTAKEQIRHALGEYKWEQEAGPHSYCRAESAKSLKDSVASGDFSRTALGALNQRAYNDLYDLVSDPLAKRWMRDFDDSEPPEAAIRAGVDRVLKVLNAQKGPAKRVPLAFMVMRLCHVYEEATGLTVRHHTKTNDLAYSQYSQTEAGRFVTRIIQIAFNDVSSTSINRFLRAFVRERPEPF